MKKLRLHVTMKKSLSRMKISPAFLSIFFLAILSLEIGSCQVVQPTTSIVNNTYPTTWDTLNVNDKQFLVKVEKAAFEYFWNGVDPNTGLGDASPVVSHRVSIATEGFALSSICIADTRGWISHQEAYQRVLLILNSFYRDTSNVNDFYVRGHDGLFYHFINNETGQRFGNSEVSTIDSGILMCGVLLCMEHFKEPAINTLARKLYSDANWRAFMRPDGGIAGEWTPENGFSSAFTGYNEYILVYLLAMGSPTHPIPAGSWNTWASTYHFINPYGTGAFLTPGGAFSPDAYLYQFPACWFNFNGIKDNYANYWQNAVNALTANRRFCLSWAKRNNADTLLWGWTACDGENGYLGYGVPFKGTVAPSAVAASIPLIPTLALPTLKYMYDKYSSKIWTPYGFTDSFNPEENWYDTGYNGIDEGNMLLMLENFRSGGVWNEFMKIPYVQTALQEAGFHRTR